MLQGYANRKGNAADLYKHCQETLAINMHISEKEKTVSIRQFVFVDKDEVYRNNVPESYHQVRNIGKSLKVERRNLSCYCQGWINAKTVNMSRNGLCLI